MSSTTTVTELAQYLRNFLETRPDAVDVPLAELFDLVDAFITDCATSPESEDLLQSLENELQAIYDDLVGHALLVQGETFLAVLYRLRPVLPPTSLISTWFELVLRPALREPKLQIAAVDSAKELILAALDTRSIPESDGGECPPGPSGQRDRVRNFRRRLMEFYLLDAYNESSNEDVLEWAELDDEQRERKACWKANLEDVLVRMGLELPQDFLTEIYHCFTVPTSRLQLVILLSVYACHPDFTVHAPILAEHPLMTSLLYSLVFDNSSTVCTCALTLLIKLLPIFAVKAPGQLKGLLPNLLVVLARVVCWKERESTNLPALDRHQFVDESDQEDLQVDSDDDREGSRPLPISDDIEWTRLELTFDGPASSAPSPHRYFTLLYYLFPCNTIRFLRFPLKYLTENSVESLYAMDWEEALDEDKIKSKSEPLLRGHILHPLLIWRDAQEELSKPDFWAKHDIPQIVASATMLDVRNAALGVRSYEATQRESSSRLSAVPTAGIRSLSPDLPHHAELPPDETIPVSSSLETVHPPSPGEAPEAPEPQAFRLRVSLDEMVATSVALKSGLPIEIMDPSPAWSADMFPAHGPSTRSPSRSDADAEPEDAGSGEAAPAEGGAVPLHVAQAISALQREVLLLRNDLNLELWTTRENVKHIGRLYKDRVLSRTAEVERQGLYNKMREYKKKVGELQKELGRQKEQAASVKKQYLDWNRKLQDMLNQLRSEKASWTQGAAAMRSAEKEAKDTFAAQSKLLAEATHRVFQLETTIKESAHKVDRLRDYETQIEQLIKLQRLWESDVHKINDSKEFIAAFTSKYKKMELRLEAYCKTHEELEATITTQRRQIAILEGREAMFERQKEALKKAATLERHSRSPAEIRRLEKGNEKLREENTELREQLEETIAMMETLRARVENSEGSMSPRLQAFP